MAHDRVFKFAFLVVSMIILVACGQVPGPAADPTRAPTTEPMPTPLPEPTPGVGSSIVNPADVAVLVYVPEGEFLRGSDQAGASGMEKPQRMVFLDAFWIYQHPVTNAQFAAFVDASGHQTIAEGAGWSWAFDGDDWAELDGVTWREPQGPGSTIAGREDHPVLHVSWFDAEAYCAWAGGRLPTEAEWEKAARGDDGRNYPWGDTPVTGDRANFCDVNCPFEWAEADQDDGYLGPSPVGSYPAGASPYGTLDMAGNVWEWVADWFFPDYYGFAPDQNPAGPLSGDLRVVRGGSWYNNVNSMSVTFRHRFTPDSTIDLLGFRCLHQAAP